MISSEYKSFADDIACELFDLKRKKNLNRRNLKTPKTPENYDVRSIDGFNSAKSYMDKNFELMKKKAINAASKILPRFDSTFFKNLYKDFL